MYMYIMYMYKYVYAARECASERMRERARLAAVCAGRARERQIASRVEWDSSVKLRQFQKLEYKAY